MKPLSRGRVSKGRSARRFRAQSARTKAPNVARAPMLESLGTPKARAEANMWSSEFGKNVAPYLSSAESMSRTGKNIRNIVFPFMKGK